ncbi:hypothetical protein BDF20DRAFT_838781 [Mycotypha africana]|uniref:uncharacterized protein n=1 Tax=Mycotypha africana TaxID=64632 RepID=UPI002301D022|nr:uncharacterized protein BDF20DRAFT_838781 [Mycotypha africana]KAI8970421.1 hypothetical protein BDF20DRAFT_838781 [Mycotypha africana]
MTYCRHINILRVFILAFSLIGLACHSAQCALLSAYEDQAKIPGWFQSGHWQYLAWFITFCLSLVSAFIICINATYCKHGHGVKADKTLGGVNLASLAVTITINTFLNDQEPWTNGIIEFTQPTRGLNFHCTLLDESHDATYPLLFQRCVLIDCTYVIAVITGHFWMFLIVFAHFFTRKEQKFTAKSQKNTKLVVSKGNRQSNYSYNNDSWKIATMSKHTTLPMAFNDDFYHHFSAATGHKPTKGLPHHSILPQHDLQQQKASKYANNIINYPPLPNLTYTKSNSSHRTYTDTDLNPCGKGNSGSEGNYDHYRHSSPIVAAPTSPYQFNSYWNNNNNNNNNNIKHYSSLPHQYKEALATNTNAANSNWTAEDYSCPPSRMPSLGRSTMTQQYYHEL